MQVTQHTIQNQVVLKKNHPMFEGVEVIRTLTDKAVQILICHVMGTN